jgi:hypothetical protein
VASRERDATSSLCHPGALCRPLCVVGQCAWRLLCSFWERFSHTYFWI